MQGRRDFTLIMALTGLLQGRRFMDRRVPNSLARKPGWKDLGLRGQLSHLPVLLVGLR